MVKLTCILIKGNGVRDISCIDWMKQKHIVGVKSISHQGVTNRS